MQATRAIPCLVLLAAMLAPSACASRQPPPPVPEAGENVPETAGPPPETPPPETPPPEAPPAEAPPPGQVPPVEEPPAAPVETILSLCVIDTSVWGGIRSVPVAVRAETGDTLAAVGEQRLPLDSVVQPVKVLSETPWYAANQPLAFSVDSARVEFSPYGPGRLIEPQQLAFIGTFGGLPLFAAREDVRGVRGELEDASRTGIDLDAVLARDARLRDRFQSIQVLYVPIRTTGCVFQPLVRS